MTPDWRIYYDPAVEARAGYCAFDSDAGAPDDAWPVGVLCIVFPDPEVGRVIMHGWDWYYFDNPTRQWWGSNTAGVQDQFMWRPGAVGALKQGRNVHNSVYRAIMRQAADDPDFPRKSAMHDRERPPR